MLLTAHVLANILNMSLVRGLTHIAVHATTFALFGLAVWPAHTTNLLKAAVKIVDPYVQAATANMPSASTWHAYYR